MVTHAGGQTAISSMFTCSVVQVVGLSIGLHLRPMLVQRLLELHLVRLLGRLVGHITEVMSCRLLIVAKVARLESDIEQLKDFKNEIKNLEKKLVGDPTCHQQLVSGTVAEIEQKIMLCEGDVEELTSCQARGTGEEVGKIQGSDGKSREVTCRSRSASSRS